VDSTPILDMSWPDDLKPFDVPFTFSSSMGGSVLRWPWRATVSLSTTLTFGSSMTISADTGNELVDIASQTGETLG
jgi:hypothetical protein